MAVERTLHAFVSQPDFGLGFYVLVKNGKVVEIDILS